MMIYSDFHSEDYKIFGLWGVENGACQCGNPDCKALFKHPRISNWQHTPNWSDEQLEIMEMTNQLATGYGVLCQGLLVIDVDARNGGIASYGKLVSEIPEIMNAGLVVATGSGGGSKHLYFSVEANIALVQHLNDFPGIDFKSSGFVVGPGSLHASGNTYDVLLGSPYDITPAPPALIERLKKPDSHRAIIDGSTIDITDDTIKDMLSYINPDCDHETWVRCGMAVHHATAGTGLGLWDDWSHGSKEGKYPGKSTMERRWHSFGKSANPVTLGTLTHYAQSAGWVMPVTFVSDMVHDEFIIDNEIDISGVDLLRPPGFVGELAKWINDQCRYPREHLSSAAALVAMGNVAGLRYTDDRDNVSLNLFAFCIAGSATGKEAVQQAMADIHRAAGIHIATHGSIKSEQEIVRNLIRNQAAYYIIDEIGILLSKIESARKRGGAAYLDGVIGQLMAAYSKATGFMLLTGDLKDAVRDALKAELASCRKSISENEDATGHAKRRIPGLERALDQIDNGLERPFLSLIGFTTPVTFDALVTREQAENGFIGRSILINERDTNPRAKRGFKKRPMPEPLRNTLISIYSGGEYDPSNARVEFYGDKIEVSTSPAAHAMLDRVLDYFEQRAEDFKSTNGFEAVPRRGYEAVAKISTILAVPSGVRTEEHVRWAFAMASRDVEEKTRLAFSNEDGGDATQKLMAAILSKISDDHGESIGVICNKMRKHKKSDVEKAVSMMHESGLIRSEKSRGLNGKEVVKYFREGN